jgi:hypothetical protein
MTVFANRSDAEAALARALSRHIGHTTAAYDLDRILSVLDFFRGRPSAYKEEVIEFLSDRGLHKDAPEDASNDYLDGIVAFARALGIIQQTSSRDMRLQKYGATEQGRSLLAARRVGSADFAAFYKARVAFLADADSLAALLTYYSDRPSGTLLDFYVTFFLQIRTQRYAWLREAFGEPVLFERIARRLGWLHLPTQGSGEARVEPFTLNTARHHSTPRKGWLTSFGMLDRETDRLTDFGERALVSLRQEGSYFWLGPGRGVQHALRVSPSIQRPGPFEDEFDFTCDQPAATPEQAAALGVSVAELMRAGFPYAKLIHATQASLQLPIEFIIYRSFADGVRYEPIEVLKNVFQEQRNRIDRLSALKGQIGFYRIK